MIWFINAIKTYPEIALFLTLAVGYAVGQLNITINPTVKSVFFLLFLFALGYNAGLASGALTQSATIGTAFIL